MGSLRVLQISALLEEVENVCFGECRIASDNSGVLLVLSDHYKRLGLKQVGMG